MKRVFGILLVVVLVVGLTLPGIPVLAEEHRGAVQASADTQADRPSGRLAADIQQLRQKADDDGRVTVVIKLEGPSLTRVAQHEVVEELQQHAARSQRRVLAFLEARGGTVLNTFWLTNAVLAEVPVGLLDRFPAFAEVERLFENFTVTVPEPAEEEEGTVGALGTSYTWGLDKIRAPEVWAELGVTGSGARVAVLDTGVDMSHPDLQGRMWTDDPADPTYPGGWAEFDGQGNIVTGSTPRDTHGHGTHCSGTVLGGDAGGTAIGVAPSAILMHGRVIPGGSGTVAQVIAGMEWAVGPFDQHGNPAGELADVVSMSLGARGYYDVFIEPTQNLRAAGVVPVIAMGNDGEGKSSGPGNVYESFGIGATDIDDNVAGFSSGEVVDWPASHPEPYVKPDFSAPGVSVYSALTGDSYGYRSGTSMATPHVAGTVALMLEADPAMTVADIYGILLDTAVWYDRYYGERPCTRYGAGRIDAFNAVSLAILDSGIEGVISAAASEEPLAGAKISVAGTGLAKYTDDSGYYRFFLPPGTHTLTAAAFGYYEDSATVEVVPDVFTPQDFSLTVLPTGFITGTVTDVDTNEPIVGAAVTLADTPLGTTTDEAGGYTIEAPIGDYEVRVASWGYKASLVSDVAVLEDETAVVDFGLEPTLAVAVLGDFESQLTNFLMDNDLSAEERNWEVTGDIARYDVVVVNRPSDPGKSAFLGFLEAASDNQVGVVFASSYARGWSYGISLLERHLGDPAGQGHGFWVGDVYYEVREPHPLFEGWEVGHKITIIKGSFSDHAWFWRYSGQTIAEVGTVRRGLRGQAVALNEYGESLHVTLAGLGLHSGTNMNDWTDDARTIFVRALMLAGGLLDAGTYVATNELTCDVTAMEYQKEDPPLLCAALRGQLAQKGPEEMMEVVIRLDAPETTKPLKAEQLDDRHTAVRDLQSKAAQGQQAITEYLALRQAEVINTFWLANAVLARVKARDLVEIAARPDVWHIHQNFEVSMLPATPVKNPLHHGLEAVEEVQSEQSQYTWGLEKIRAPEVWTDLGMTGSGVRVAVLDTGVDMGHPDLQGRMWTDDPADPTFPGGWIEFDGQGNIVAGSTPHDTHGHGTHCSGTVLGGDASGTAIGVAPDAILMHGLVLYGTGGTFAQVIGGMQWTIDPVDQHGNPAGAPADVVSMSLGSTGHHTAFVEPVQNVRSAGILPVIAIGNSGEGSSSSPGNVYDAFGIGATNAQDNIASFSSGHLIDWPASHPEPYIKPDFSAPGVSVYSATPGGGYGSWQGTSMAAPHVAGTAALMLEADPVLTVDEVYEVLRDTAVWYDRYYDERPCTRYGWGRVDAFEAVHLVTLDCGIDGVVADSETGQPLKGARIAVSETSSTQYTDDSGYYRFFLAPGIYTVSVDTYGYHEETEAVEVVADTFTTQDFALELLPTGFIEGVVTHLQTGQPIEGATVTIPGTPLGAKTNESGEYSIEAPVGTYDARAWAWGFKASLADDVDVTKDDVVILDFGLEKTLSVAVLGDYLSQLTQLLMASDISAEERNWDVTDDLSRYDVVVVNSPSDPGETAFLGFLDAASDNQVGVIFTSSWPVSAPFGISLLQKHLGDPSGQGYDYGSLVGDVRYEVREPHPLFEGWEVGDRITIVTGGDRDHGWFWRYSQVTIAEVATKNLGQRGEAVALDEYGGSLHVLLASMGIQRDTNVTHWTKDAKTIFARAVMMAGGTPDSSVVISTSDLPAGVAGNEYQAHLEASGGTEPYTWTIINGALPDGLELDADTGVISGTPVVVDGFDFTVQVTDTEEETASADLSITIVDSLDIATTELPDATVGATYEAIVEAAGGVEPYAWAIIDGALPAGLALDADTGVISGTATEYGTFGLTVQVTDDTGETATAALSIVIDAEPLKIVTTDLPDGQAGAAYEATLEAAGGVEPYTWAVIDGALPAGLDLDAATGVISGMPSATGSFDFTVQVTDDTGDTATAELSISIAPEPLEIITTELPNGQVGVAYEATLEAAGGVEPYTWAVIDGILPAGLALDADTGVISGTATDYGTFGLTVKVTDDTGETATAALSITIDAEPLEIVTTDLPDGQVGVAYEVTLEAEGGIEPYTWAINDGALPAGLDLDADTGVISGTPTSTGSFDFTVQVTNPTGQTDSAELSMSIEGGHGEFVYELASGWNMVSLPLYTEDTDPGELFPGAAVIYAWDPVNLSYYVPAELVPGRGYWILYFTAASVTIQGAPVEEYELTDGVAGQHMIGSLFLDAGVTATEGNVYNLFYWWNPETLSYEATDTLKPGRGYWLLGFSGFSIKVQPTPPPPP